MNFRNSVFLAIALLCMVAYVRCDDVDKPSELDDHDKNVIPQSTAPLGDFSFPSGLTTLLTGGGILASALLALGALAIMVAPLFGLRLCTIFGTCDSTGYQGYSSGPSYNDYTGYQQGSYNSPAYQKRSLEYIGPILKTLVSAYDKYSSKASLAQALKNRRRRAAAFNMS